MGFNGESEMNNNTCTVCGCLLIDGECEQCSYTDLNSYGHSRTKIISKLREKITDLEKALEPFAHEDLSILLGGNVEGDNSPVYQRNKAKLFIRNFKLAKELLSEN